MAHNSDMKGDRKFIAEKENKPRKLLKEEIAEIDKSLLRLLLKRNNLLLKLRARNRSIAEDEKSIREAWRSETAKYSQDPDVQTTLFSLLQNMRFKPRPEKKEGSSEAPQKKRDAFNLNPPHLPVSLEMIAPFSSRLTRIWLYLASSAGQSLGLSPILPSAGLSNCIDVLRQLGAVINNEIDNVGVVAGMPLQAPDVVIHIGQNEFNFYLVLAHYICHPSKAKITGQPHLGQNVLRTLTSFLPKLGARLTCIIPKTNSLPVRIESAGLLPEKIEFSPSVPENFILCLIAASLFSSRPVAFDLGNRENSESLFQVVQEILEKTGITWIRDNFTINLEPTSLAIPPKPSLPMDFASAMFLLSFAEPLRGRIRLNGRLSNTQEEKNFWQLLKKLGFAWQSSEEYIENDNKNILNKFELDSGALKAVEPLPDFADSLLASLACCSALAGGMGSLPDQIMQNPVLQDFLSVLGLDISEKGQIRPVAAVENSIPWVAPSADWAIALAIAACANRSSKRVLLANPGIVADKWSGFWNIYNGLPAPRPKRITQAQVEIKKGRRIHTTAIATLPPEDAAHEE